MPEVKQVEILGRDVPSIAPTVVTPMDMIGRAVADGAAIDTLTQLMGLQERWERNQARKAFDNAMATARAEIPVIAKNRTVAFPSQKGGGRTSYRHEDLAEIARTIDPIIATHGLSYRYRTSVDGDLVSVTCIVSHRDGHSEENTLTAGRDASGSKNNIQALGSAITYLQRYSLKAAFGLAAAADDDSNAGEAGGPITEEQVGKIRSLIVDVAADIKRFCTYMGVPRIEDIPSSEFTRAIDALHAKRNKQ